MVKAHDLEGGLPDLERVLLPRMRACADWRVAQCSARAVNPGSSRKAGEFIEAGGQALPGGWRRRPREQAEAAG
jgi:hypothetical protein